MGFETEHVGRVASTGPPGRAGGNPVGAVPHHPRERRFNGASRQSRGQYTKHGPAAGDHHRFNGASRQSRGQSPARRLTRRPPVRFNGASRQSRGQSTAYHAMDEAGQASTGPPGRAGGNSIGSIFIFPIHKASTGPPGRAGGNRCRSPAYSIPARRFNGASRQSRGQFYCCVRGCCSVSASTGPPGRAGGNPARALGARPRARFNGASRQSRGQSTCTAGTASHPPGFNGASRQSRGQFPMLREKGGSTPTLQRGLPAEPGAIGCPRVGVYHVLGASTGPPGRAGGNWQPLKSRC